MNKKYTVIYNGVFSPTFEYIETNNLEKALEKYKDIYFVFDGWPQITRG